MRYQFELSQINIGHKADSESRVLRTESRKTDAVQILFLCGTAGVDFE